ncbi:MAG: hypothetical protein QOF70_1006, partial [Acetobacteraceae bacterium]|nr:hypothetical protein [Acetobacteraceae bacterium]
TLVAYRLIDPGSEWRLHRQWYERSAMGDLLGEDFDLVQKDNFLNPATLYRASNPSRRRSATMASAWSSPD